LEDTAAEWSDVMRYSSTYSLSQITETAQAFDSAIGARFVVAVAAGTLTVAQMDRVDALLMMGFHARQAVAAIDPAIVATLNG
jgi:hypothetical protein